MFDTSITCRLCIVKPKIHKRAGFFHTISDKFFSGGTPVTKWMKPALAALFITLICLFPGAAAQSAAQSLAVWATAVVPTLLPFLIAVPALTCPEVCALFARVSGGFLRALRLPAACPGAVLIGLMSGSPAGAAALAASIRSETDPAGSYLRAAVLASGASPAFLLSSVASAMLDTPSAGWLLLRSQIFSALAAVLLLRSFGRDRTGAAPFRPSREHGAVLSAALTLLTIGGYMVLFSVLARLLSLLTGPTFETPLLAVMELAGGCRALSSLSLPLDVRLPLISAASCFGGASVCAQCLSFLRPAGVKPTEYVAAKLLHSALAAAFTFLQLRLSSPALNPSLLGISALSVLLLLIMSATVLNWRRPSNSSMPPSCHKGNVVN